VSSDVAHHNMEGDVDVQSLRHGGDLGEQGVCVCVCVCGVHGPPSCVAKLSSQLGPEYAHNSDMVMYCSAEVPTGWCQ